MRALLVCLFLAAGAAALALAPATASAAQKTCKGSVTAMGKRAKVVIIRNVGCRKAKRVARRIGKGRLGAGWACGGESPSAPKIGGRRPWMACGRGGEGQLRDRRQAFVLTIRA